MELRHNSTTQCAGGRITGGAPGDEIWVEGSADGGTTWSPMRGFTTITPGNDAYTTRVL
ncbi:lipase maturation factor family protein [Streptomyces cyaneochromogenes]|uniref:lipase maturation factor family protein n=1 Tax=Streptomyces cyaneochromogenes TaxID=2496836 RepID=UPI0011AEC115|nr:lipase maturation factor family protein [Streptomyces cyaneochromogenes]